jgi:hypothetical protein
VEEGNDWLVKGIDWRYVFQCLAVVAVRDESQRMKEE